MRLLACALALVAALVLLADLDLRVGDGGGAAPLLIAPVVGGVAIADELALPFGSLLLSPVGETFGPAPQPTPEPTPTPSILADAQVISYYGNPYVAAMGILGAADPETIVALLEMQAARYDELNGPLGVVPALHLVYGVAQREPMDDGSYLLYTADEDVQRYLALTEERGMLLFLDLQIGRNSVEEELQRVLPYLRNPQVHIALDPEFAMSEGQVPGTVIGSLRAADINQAQAILQKLVEEEGLPPKMLIVHQFVDWMVLDGEEIERYPGVELIIDMDGFGPAEIKRAIYERYANRPYAFNAAIKLFFELDTDMMSEEEVLSLEPLPAIVIYQ